MSRKRSSDTPVIDASTSDSFELSASALHTPTESQLKNRPKLRIRIKKFHGVAHWTWNCGDDDDDVCGICQSAYEGVAPGAKYPGDECPVVVGKCRHYFHLQCITTWISTRNSPTCPLCRQEWDLGVETSRDDGNN